MQVERLNNLLRAELGSDPPFAWQYSEKLLRVVLQTDNLGRPEMEYRQVNGVFTAQQARFVRKLDWKLTDQWVMCMLVKMSEDQGHLYGTGDAAWLICYDKRGNPCALEPGIIPDALTTWRFIRLEKEARLVTAAQEVRDEIERQKKEQEKLRDDAAYAARDALPAFVEIPGEKGATAFQAGIRDTQLNKETQCQP